MAECFLLTCQQSYILQEVMEKWENCKIGLFLWFLRFFYNEGVRTSLYFCERGSKIEKGLEPPLQGRYCCQKLGDCNVIIPITTQSAKPALIAGFPSYGFPMVNWQRFSDLRYISLLLSRNVEQLYQLFENSVEQAATETMRRTKFPTTKISIPWWMA